MSWFTELAGKAESLLEKVDTAAATALTKEQANQEAIGLISAVPTVNPASTQRTAPVPLNNQEVDISRAPSESSVLGGKDFLACYYKNNVLTEDIDAFTPKYTKSVVNLSQI